MKDALLWAAAGTGFTFLMTSLGASVVFLFRKRINENIQRIFLGFAAGVMIAASVWSLLIPAIEEAEASGIPGFLPAAGGFILGVGFLMLMDSLLPHLHLTANRTEGLPASWKRTTLLVTAVTLHNIPEGMAVGLSFALAAQGGSEPALFASALALALGIGIRGRRHIAAAQAGGHACGKGVCLRKPVRSSGAHIRRYSSAARLKRKAPDALAALLCSGRDDVCGG